MVGMRRSRKVYGALDIVTSQHTPDSLGALYYRELVPESTERNNQRHRQNDNARIGQCANSSPCVRESPSLWRQRTGCPDLTDVVRESTTQITRSSHVCESMNSALRVCTRERRELFLLFVYIERNTRCIPAIVVVLGVAQVRHKYLLKNALNPEVRELNISILKQELLVRPNRIEVTFLLI